MSRFPRWALLPLRLVVGFGFLAHGWAKWSRGPGGFAKLLAQIGAPVPAVSAWVVTLTEILGGIAILLGALVAIVSIPLMVSMLVAMFTVQLRFGFSSVNTIGLTPSGPVFGPPGYEINLLYIGALLAIALAGPGAWSVDEWFHRRRAAAGRGTTGRDDVSAAEDGFFGALLRGDGDALRALVTPDFVLIDVMTGSELPGTVLVDLVGGRQLVFEAIERIDSRVRAYGSAAVVTGQTRMRGRYQDQFFSAHSRYTHVYLRADSRWRLGSAQGTPIGAGSPA
jgi:putative oxidoreductase